MTKFIRSVFFGAAAMGLFLLMASSAYAAAPTFTIQTHGTNNTSAIVVLKFSEGVANSAAHDTILDAADFTVGGSDVLTISSISHALTPFGAEGANVGSRHVILTMSGNIAVAGTGEVTIACAGTAVYNAGGEACVQGATDVDSTNDSTAPVAVSKLLSDDDQNGKPEIVYIVFNEPVVVKGQSGGFDDATNWSVSAGGHTGLTESAVFVGRNYGGASGAVDGNYISYNFSEGSVLDTTVSSLTYTYTPPGAGSRVADLFGNELAAGYTDVAPTDSMTPVIRSFTYQDGDSNGKIDRFLITFTETVVASSTLSANDFNLTNVGNFTSAAFGADLTDLVTTSVSSVTVVLGTEATVVDTAENSGTIAVSTQNGFNLADADGNQGSSQGAQTQAGFVDGAVPIMTEITVYDVDSDGKVDFTDLQFSEAMDDSTDTTAANWEIGDTVAESISTATCDSLTNVADDSLLCISITTDANEVVGTNLKTIDYVGSSLTDMNGNGFATANDVGLTKLDEAAPVFVSAETLDNNTDGTVDYVKIEYSETISDTSVAASDFQAGIADTTAGNLTESYSSEVPNSGDETDTQNDQYIYIGITDGTETLESSKTDYTIRIQQTGAISDRASPAQVLASFAATVSTDGAKPLPYIYWTRDNNNDGTVDYVSVVFTEPVLDSTVAASDFELGIADTTAGNLIETFTSLTPSSGNQTDTANDATIYIGISNGTETLSALTTNYALFGELVGSVDDLNSVTRGPIVGADTGTDGAAPIIKTVDIYDTDANGTIDKIIFTWTENVDTDDNAPPVAADLPTTLLPDGSTADYGTAVISDPAGASAVVTITGITGQVTVNSATGSTAISGDLSAIWKDNRAGQGPKNAAHATGATASESITDSALPAMLTAVMSIDGTTGRNELAFTFSEAMYIDNTNQDGVIDAGDTTLSESIASAAAFGNIDAVGSIEAMGNFAVAGNVDDSGDTVDYWTMSADGKTATLELAYASNSYLVSTSTTAPSGAFTPDGAAGGDYFLAQAPASTLAAQRLNTSGTPTVSGSWDLTKPTVSSAVLSDAYQDVSAGTTGSDGKVDQLVLTASETLRTVADSADTKDDWTLTSGATEFGSAMVITSAYSTASTTSYTVLFSGANIQYEPTTFTLAAASDEWSLADRAGNILPPTTKVCMSAYVCTGGTANYAVITMDVQSPGAAGGGDTAAPGKPTNIKVTQIDNTKVIVTWTDPKDADLNSITILRGKNGRTITGSPYGAAGKGYQIYEDGNFEIGDTLEYMLKAIDSSNNASGPTEKVSVNTKVIVVPEPIVPPVETPSGGGEVTPDTLEKEKENPVEEPEIVLPPKVQEEVDEVSKVFPDMKKISWAAKSVSNLFKKGIVKGKKEGEFAPADNLNRAEAAAMLYRILLVNEPVTPVEDPFVDVNRKAWYAGYISYLKNIGIIMGNPDWTYLPKKSINRAEFLTMLLRIFEYNASDETLEKIRILREGPKTDHYVDLDEDWYTENITVATGLGIVSGSEKDGKHYFNANATINRAEAAHMINNAFFKD